MSRVFEANIESISIRGRTFDVCDAVNLEDAANAWGARSLTEHREPFSVSCDVVIGIRDGRRLLIGRPRPRRAITKARNQEKRELRRSLVEMAGWHRLRSGAVVGVTLEYQLSGRVSVPRSLRPLLGRWIGGQ